MIKIAAMLTGATLATGAIQPALATSDGAPEGRYAVIDHRIAGGVAATSASYDPESRRQELGQTIAYAGTLTWYDGRFCDDWQWSSGPAPDPIADDPNLADLQAGTPANLPLVITCAGNPFAEVVQVDARVQVGFIPNGTMYVVLERIPDEEEVAAIQEALRERGHYHGPVDGALGAATRDAVAAFAAAAGLGQPRTGILTDAVVRALRDG